MPMTSCHVCGAEPAEGAQFCGACGAPLSAAPNPPAQVQADTGAPKKKRGCLGCVIGLLVVAVLFACLGLVVAGWYFRWPVQLGLVESPGQTLFEPSPDPYAAEALLTELAESGVAVDGISIYVVPTEQGELVAYVLAEEADGFAWNGPTYDNAIEGLLILTAVTEAAIDLEIGRVAVDYRGPEGEQVAVMTAPVPLLTAYYYDAVTQEQLFDEMNGRAGGAPSISLGGE